MSAGSGTSQTSEKAGVVTTLLKFVVVGTITGLGFGLVMATRVHRYVELPKGHGLF